MIGLILEAGKTFFKWMKEKSVAKHERNMAALELEKRLLLSKQEANSQWEIAQLKDKSKFLRWAAFLLFASPLLISFISPSYGREIQQFWHTMPAWQADGLKGFCLAVFGMRQVPMALQGIVGAVKQGLK